MFETFKKYFFELFPKPMHNVSLTKQGLCVAKQRQNRGSLLQRKNYVFINESVCLNQTGHLYMFDFATCIHYAVMSQPLSGYCMLNIYTYVYLAIPKYIQIYLDISGYIWIYMLEASGRSYIYLVLSGYILTYLEIFGYTL